MIVNLLLLPDYLWSRPVRWLVPVPILRWLKRVAGVVDPLPEQEPGAARRRRQRGDERLGPEADAVELTHESLAGCSQELIDALREAVVTADLDLLLARIHDVEACDTQAARGLRRLAEAFQYQKLLDVLNTGATVGSAQA